MNSLQTEVNQRIKVLEEKKINAVKKHQGTKGVDNLLKPLYQERFDLNEANGAEQLESIQDYVAKTSPFLKPLFEFASLLDVDNLTERQQQQQKVAQSSAGKILGSFIWSLGNTLKNQENFLDDRMEDHKQNLESKHAGGDKHEESIADRKAYIEVLQTSIDEIEEVMNCLKVIYTATLGIDYEPFTKGTSKATFDKQKETAGRADALDMIAKHEAKKQARKLRRAS